MLLPIKKFYKLFKDPEKPEDELIFNWGNEKLLEVKTKKKLLYLNQIVFLVI